MQSVRCLIEEKHMPRTLALRVKNYYHNKGKADRISNHDVLMGLPDAIRADVHFYIYGKCIVEAISGDVMPTEIIIEIFCRSMKAEAGPGRCCPPRHPSHFERSFLALHGILSRGEQYLPGRTSIKQRTDCICFTPCDMAGNVCQALGGGVHARHAHGDAERVCGPHGHHHGGAGQRGGGGRVHAAG